jgi:predicted transcriptional regulator
MVAHNEPGVNVWTPEARPPILIRALEMRRKGCSYPKIADELGVSLSTAYRYVNHELERLAKERRIEGEKVLEIELARLDRLTEAIMDRAEAGSLDHMEAVLKLMDRRAKLLGLNAPNRNIHEIDDKRALPDVELYNRTRALLLRLQAAGHDVGDRLLELSPFEAIQGEVLEAVKDAAKPENSHEMMHDESLDSPSHNITNIIESDVTPSATPSHEDEGF